jgi:hypothetical protein
VSRGFFLPARASSIVDLPDPLGPMIAIIDPGSAYPAKRIWSYTQQTNLISVLQYMRSSKNLERESERASEVFFLAIFLLIKLQYRAAAARWT